MEESGALVVGTFEQEFCHSLDNLQRILEAAGSGLDHVVLVRSYVRDPANTALYNR